MSDKWKLMLKPPGSHWWFSSMLVGIHSTNPFGEQLMLQPGFNPTEQHDMSWRLSWTLLLSWMDSDWINIVKKPLKAASVPPPSLFIAVVHELPSHVLPTAIACPDIRSSGSNLVNSWCLSASVLILSSQASKQTNCPQTTEGSSDKTVLVAPEISSTSAG